ncbi:histidinol dehydrogenase [candidate division KSB1 bacterium]|nr:histidinol dehydrogenase [candidate division KSB1 bacterium]
MLRIFEKSESFLASRQSGLEYLNSVATAVQQIIQAVRQHQDQALQDFSQRFDGVACTAFRVPLSEIEQALAGLPIEVREILDEAAANIRNFHQRQYPQSWLERAADGTQLGQKFTPISRVGVYIPGGTAAYPSSVLMNVIPAQIAGVPQIVVISPPKSGGKINATVLATLGLLEIQEIYAVGGAHGIAALAYGTESIPRVYKITGPGNAYVMEAKRQVFGQVGIDSLAGPTELVVIGDSLANPTYIARDLMAQAEHDVHAAAILITPAQELIHRVNHELARLTATASRQAIITQALSNNGAALLVSGWDEAIAVTNEIAPEHLEILIQNPAALIDKIQHAGAIFWGEYSTEPVGDYWAGPNHTLPTNGTAKFSSPLGVLDFMKHSSLIHYSKSHFLSVARKIEHFAQLEGLENHRLAIGVRHD